MKQVLTLAGILVLFVTFNTGQAKAADLQWSGRYRAEGVFIKNFTLDKNAGVEDSYLIHHLILEPKIIAADGLNIKTRFDIFNNALANNQAGQVMGSYTGTTNNAGQASPSAVMTHTQQDETVLATELYLNWINEFGALTVGRVPFDFGLGMLYSSGNGSFDHFHSTKDLVAYKLALGNLSFMPAYGKVRESVLGTDPSNNNTSEDDINDYMVVVDYTNPETDLSMGFMFDTRVGPNNAASPSRGNDIQTSFFTEASGGTAQIFDGFNAYNMNFYVKKKSDNFNIGVEAGFLTGYTGAKFTNTLDRVELSGFGVAAEVGYRTGSLSLDLRAGMASGDDPDTPNYEGYFFSPNYNVAMLMFNYTLGQYDLLRSRIAGTRAAADSGVASQQALAGLDTETISNAIYFSPALKFALGERYDLLATFTYATLQKQPGLSASGSTGTSLGFETDLGLSYHPNDRFTWRTEIGLLLPGSAWQGTASQNFANDLAYGATTKAAINF